MVRNPDPKPGRWILPLVVLGMVFFTWAFVQRLEPEVIADDAPISTTTTVAESEGGEGETGSAEETPDETTATTLPADLAAFLTDIVADQEALAVLATEMDTANAAWDNDEAGYGETETSLLELRDEAAVFRDTVVLRQAPAGYTDIASAFEDAVNAAEGVAGSAEDVLAGLRAPDTGQARRSALLEFRSAAEAFNQAVAAMELAAEGAAG